MLRHLRLARSRGSLKAPNSPVQDRALEYLDALDEVAQREARMDSVRLALATSPDEQVGVRDLFPEYFDAYEAAKTEDGDYDIDRLDDSKVEWGTPSGPEDDEALSQWIASREVGSLSAADFE